MIIMLESNNTVYRNDTNKMKKKNQPIIHEKNKTTEHR